MTFQLYTAETETQKLQNWEQALRESVHGDDLFNSPFP